MKEYRITIDINREGQINADANGFTGEACLKDLDRLLDGLSAGQVEVKRKPEAGAARTRSTRTSKTQQVGKKS